jgi:hypothetical protein
MRCGTLLEKRLLTAVDGMWTALQNLGPFGLERPGQLAANDGSAAEARSGPRRAFICGRLHAFVDALKRL